jgi:hypothetical protein
MGAHGNEASEGLFLSLPRSLGTTDPVTTTPEKARAP